MCPSLSAMKVNPGYKEAGQSCFFLAHIAVRDLSADEICGDETDEREREIDERGIVVTPHVTVERP